MSTKAACVNTVGIALVAAGSIFVSYEVVQRFKGERYETVTQAVTDASRLKGSALGARVVGISTTKAEDSQEYRAWERRRNVVMSIGLGLILIGSAVQIWASWIDS